MNNSVKGFTKENRAPIKHLAAYGNEEKINSLDTKSEYLDQRTSGITGNLHTSGHKKKECLSFCGCHGFTNQIDFTCFLGFNFAYLVFNMIYWVAYY